MIQVRATAFAKITAAVAPERGLISLNSNRHWLLIEGTHRSICTGAHINEASDDVLNWQVSELSCVVGRISTTNYQLPDTASAEVESKMSSLGIPEDMRDWR